MALPILDGNQTSTTLATTVSGGAHYPNHIIASGTVTAVLSVDTIFNDGGDRLNVGLGSVVGTDPANWLKIDGGNVPISGTVTASVANSITIGALPVQLSTTTIGGTARLNVTLSSATTVGATAPSYANLYGGSDGTNLRAISVDSSGRTVVTGTTSILGTSAVTFGAVTGSVSILGTPSVTMGAISGTVTANTDFATGGVGVYPPNKSVWVGFQQSGGNFAGVHETNNRFPVQVGNSVTIGSLPAISGTVTASVSSTTVTVSALPSGALTTRFGSVTTANTAQLTAAVTNSARRYLLCQNLDPSVTVTIGIGFTPTTTQGIQLAAGGGIIMDSFVSTGAVWWLSSSAGSNFSILEG